MLVSGTAIGRYQVKRKLAEGGMAEIFLAAATGPEGFEKEVVIKRIRSFLAKDQTFIEMFKAEARLASRLNHANIVQIFDFAMHEDTYFIAMEFVHGGSLWDVRRRCRELGVPFPPALVAEIGAQVARGLHYAHGLTEKGKLVGLVHRDVTPHNVLLGFDGAVKLTDFGIAKAGTSFTAPGMLKGKFAYMSPEQGRGEPVDARTDVFALGVVLWEMLTGGRLFEGESDVAVLRAVQVSEIAPPTRLNPEVPDQLSQVVMKALARPVDQRHQTAQELERALAAVALQHAKSVEDVNVGAFVRQIYKDDLLAEQEEQLKQGTQSVTPMPVEVSLGGTMFKDRSGEHEARAGSQPSQPAPSEDKPRTDLMPGVRSSRKLPIVENPDDSSAARTDTMDSELRRPKTDLQPKRPSSKKIVVEPEEPTFTPATKLPPQQTETPSITDRNPDRLQEPSEQPTARPGSYRVPAPSGETPATQPPDEPIVAPRRSVLPWVVVGLLALGLLGGVFGSSLFADHSSGVSTVQDVTPPLPPPPVKQPEVQAVVEPPKVAPVEEASKPVDPVKPEPKPVEAPVKAAPIAYGTLLVKAVPFAEVFVDGRQIGDAQGGTKRFSVPAGAHKVRLHHPKRDTEKLLLIKPGDDQLIEFNALEPSN